MATLSNDMIEALAQEALDAAIDVIRRKLGGIDTGYAEHALTEIFPEFVKLINMELKIAAC